MNPFQDLPQIAQQDITVLILTIWTIAWKGVALWHSARVDQKQWFVALLIINTVGVLEIAYLFFFSKKKLIFQEVVNSFRDRFQKLKK